MRKLKEDYKAGDKYGKLMLTGKAYFSNGKKYVECICDCGIILFKHLTKLKSGLTRLCGSTECKVSDNILEGEVYGRLTTTGFFEIRKKMIYVEVVCECGDKSYKRLGHLKDGTTVSCGIGGCKVHTFDSIYSGHKGEVYSYFTLTGGSKIIKGIRNAEAICKCGTVRYITLGKLKDGSFKSCGCMKKQLSSIASTKHGLSKHPIYNSYSNMMRRCYIPEDDAYKNYGERGIKVCDEWRYDIMSFYKWSIANGWEEGLEIDRFPNNENGDYEPSNCRWATSAIQNRNKRNNRNIDAFGEIKCLAEWVRDFRCIVNKKTLLKRIRMGINSELAMSKRFLTS